VEAGRFVMAWIGVLDQETLTVKPVAWDGEVHGFFDAAPLALTAVGVGSRVLAGQAVGGRRPVISNDAQNDPLTFMKKEAQGAGDQLARHSPLIVADVSIGVLALYARRSGSSTKGDEAADGTRRRHLVRARSHREGDRLDYLAYYDAATGIANRKLLLERLDQRMRIAAEQKSGLALAILDVERFKSINDTLGRHAGDQLLKVLAERFVTFLGDPDRVGRVFGDQFGSSFPMCTVQTKSRASSNKNSRNALATGDARGSELRALGRWHRPVPRRRCRRRHAVQERRSRAQARQGGRRALPVYAQQMTRRVAENLALENRCGCAGKRRVRTAPTSPRWTRRRGESRASNLDPLAKPRARSGSADAIHPPARGDRADSRGRRWALHRAALDPDAGRSGAWTVRASPSTSRRSRCAGGLVESTLDSIGENGNRAAIDLEVTESLIMEDIEANIVKFEALRLAGMEIAIDDFGTGYSSLAYLAKLPVQSLKIDRSFVMSMLKDPAVMTLVSTIVSLAHSLKLKVVAEAWNPRTGGRARPAGLRPVAGLSDQQAPAFRRDREAARLQHMKWKR